MIVVTATRLEERAARRALRDIEVVRTGIGRGGSFDDAVVSCGLAGGLATDLPTGTVLIPGQIARPSGDRVVCDGELTERLRAAARRLGLEPVAAPLLTSSTLVRGETRRLWASRGYAGVDMESGAIFAPRLAAVRVVLDTPARELSDAWLRPLGALREPRAWLELPWLAREAPRCARLAAAIAAAAFDAER